eukprot:sb/3463861/
MGPSIPLTPTSQSGTTNSSSFSTSMFCNSIHSSPRPLSFNTTSFMDMGSSERQTNNGMVINEPSPLKEVIEQPPTSPAKSSSEKQTKEKQVTRNRNRTTRLANRSLAYLLQSLGDNEPVEPTTPRSPASTHVPEPSPSPEPTPRYIPEPSPSPEPTPTAVSDERSRNVPTTNGTPVSRNPYLKGAAIKRSRVEAVAERSRVEAVPERSKLVVDPKTTNLTNNTSSIISTCTAAKSTSAEARSNKITSAHPAKKPCNRPTLTKPTLRKTTQFVIGNYIKAAKWSPDGFGLVTCSRDKAVRLYGVPDPNTDTQQVPISKYTMSNEPYDVEWNPWTKHIGNSDCNLLATCKDSPVQLLDPWTGTVIGSYTAFNHFEILLSAFSLCYMSSDTFIGGYCKEARLFNLNRPGKESQLMTAGDMEHQNNNAIISALARHPTYSGTFAAGSYNTTLSLYSTQIAGPILPFYGPERGITQLMFSADVNRNTIQSDPDLPGCSGERVLPGKLGYPPVNRGSGKSGSDCI